MKKSILMTLILGIVASINIDCGDENPVTVDPPIDNSKIDWPNIKILIKDTASMNDIFEWKIILDDFKKIDSMQIKDSINYKTSNGYDIYTSEFGKQDLMDTMIMIEDQIGNDNAINSHIIRMCKNGKIKDTTVSILVIDNMPVQVISGTFYTQDLKIGDSLTLYIKVKSQTPYYCQWYKDGKKIGEEFLRQSDDSICYGKANLQLEDAGEYSISLNKPNAKTSQGGMIVNVTK
jgi:hypothetical protein